MAQQAEHTRSRRGGPRPKCDGRALFSRGQAARFLGGSVEQIRWLEQTKQLHPAVGPGGARIFRREDLEDYLNAQPGSLAARAFACFERGLSPQQTVIDLHAIPTSIAALHAEWIRMSGAWVVAGPRGSREQWERAYGIGALTPLKLRRALELIGANSDLRAKLHDASKP